jgi:putative sterol carrier protein
MRRKAMTHAGAGFFDELQRRGHEPALEKERGLLRFDLRNGGKTARWLVSVDRGDVNVSHKSSRADCVVRMDQALFDRIVNGEANAIAALLRGAFEAEGDLSLLAAFQRLFPGPPTT